MDVRARSTWAVASSACTPASVRDEPTVRTGVSGAPANLVSASSRTPCTERAFCWR